jgi:hypothetical protein
MSASASAVTAATGSASLTDILTAIKNLVLAVNTASTAYLNVNGQRNAAGLTANTVISTQAGRVATVSVLVAGTSVGVLFDGTTLTATTKPLGVIPNTVGVFSVNMPFSFGLVYVAGAGQQVTIGYS